MKNTLYTIALIAVAAIACKQGTKPAGQSGEEAAAAQKQIEEKYTEAVKARIVKIAMVDSGTLEKLLITNVDSATERMAQEHFCMLLENVKKAVDTAVVKQKLTVEAAAFIPQLAAGEKQALKQLLEKQKNAHAEYAECIKKAETLDNSVYKYYRIRTEAFVSSPGGVDTLRGPYFVDKADFTVKTF